MDACYHGAAIHARPRQGGEDAERAAGYGPLANWQEMIQETFKNMFSGANPPDPQAVSDAVVELGAAEAGSCPGRTTIDKLMPGTADMVQDFRDAVIRHLGGYSRLESRD